MNGAAHHEHPESDAAQRYVAGTLPDREIAAFEQHLLGCAECREEVQSGAAISAALRSTPATARAAKLRLPWVAASLAAAAVIVVAMWPRDSLRQLARLDTPPRFERLAVRSAATPTDALVDSAMDAYAAGDYAAARERFASLPDGTGGSGAQFFYGAAALADGEPAVARAPLQRVAADSTSAYAPRARVLLAKALIGIGRADSALAVLAASSDPSARALADSIEARRK
jgi:TolA-binding protein